ncbi:MarR family transcriptional regulator [soil metagenome]
MTVRKEDYATLASFRKSLRRFLRFAEEGAKEFGVTPQQHQVLLAIMGHTDRDWASIGELADSLQLKPHATVGLVNRCQAAGLVERSPDSHDRRIVRVTLSLKGAEILEGLTQRNLSELKALARLTNELEALSAAL